METEEPVFCIIHNYRRPHPQPLPEAPLEPDSQQLDTPEASSTDATYSELHELPHPD